MQIRKPILDRKSLKAVPALAGSELESTIAKSGVIRLDEALIEQALFDGKEFDELDISASQVDRLSLLSSKVEEVKILDSELKNCNFAGAAFSKTYFERAVITGSRLQGTQMMELVARDVFFEKSKCIDCSFRFSKMKDVVFLGCDLSRADFLGAQLEHVAFLNCDLKNSQFSQTKLKNVSFKGSDINGIALDKESLGSITVNTGQALYLASLLGLHIED